MLTDEQKKLIEENLNCIYAAVWKYCKTADDDISQDAVLAVCKSIDKFNPEKGTFATWVYTVVRNMVIRKIEYANRPARSLMKTVPFYVETEEGEMEISDFIGFDEQGFDDINSEIDCKHFFEKLDTARKGLNSTENKMLDKMIELEGKATPTSLAKELNCSKQNIYVARQIMGRKLYKAKKFLL